jgi:hypothetical protein
MGRLQTSHSHVAKDKKSPAEEYQPATTSL